jgi:nicotinate-nucleotide adenylyltransferase
MGGTFDPVHYGHLAAAEEARRRFELARVIFVPSGRPPHKKEREVSPAEARYEMVALATASNPAFEASRVEVDRPGPSYSADTMEWFRRSLGEEVKLYFITGADAMLEIMTWHDPQRLGRVCEFIAVMRPGYELGPLEKALGPALLARTQVLEVAGVAVSSTELRRRAVSGRSLRYLTPPAVISYIRGRRLYALEREGDLSGKHPGGGGGEDGGGDAVCGQSALDRHGG